MMRLVSFLDQRSKYSIRIISQFYDEASQPVKVKDEIFGTSVNVLQDRVHKLELRRLDENHDPIRKWRLFTRSLKLG